MAKMHMHSPNAKVEGKYATKVGSTYCGKGWLKSGDQTINRHDRHWYIEQGYLTVDGICKNCQRKVEDFEQLLRVNADRAGQTVEEREQSMVAMGMYI